MVNDLTDINIIFKIFKYSTYICIFITICIFISTPILIITLLNNNSTITNSSNLTYNILLISNPNWKYNGEKKMLNYISNFLDDRNIIYTNINPIMVNDNQKKYNKTIRLVIL